MTQPSSQASVTAADPDPQPIRVIGRLPLQLSTAERSEFERRTAELASLTRLHDRVSSYSCNADIEVPGTYVFDEIWPSREVFEAHLQTAHFQRWWAWVEPRLQGSLVIDTASLSSFQRVG